MSYDDRVIVAGRNPRAEALSVGWLKIPPCGDENVRCGIQAQEIRAPLLCQMIGHHIQILVREPQSPGFHPGRYHLKGFARAHAVCQQRVATIEDVRDGVLLVLHERDLRRHPDKADVTAVVFTRSGRVEELVVFGNQCLTTTHVLKNPFLEGSAQHFLFLLCENSGLFVQHTLFAINSLDGHVDFRVFKVQRVLQKMEGVGLFGAVGGVDQGVACIVVLTGDVPYARYL